MIRYKFLHHLAILNLGAKKRNLRMHIEDRRNENISANTLYDVLYFIDDRRVVRSLVTSKHYARLPIHQITVPIAFSSVILPHRLCGTP